MALFHNPLYTVGDARERRLFHMKKNVLDSAISYAGLSRLSLAEKAGMYYKSLNKSISSESIKQPTIKALCDAMGARYEERIIFPDGQTFTSSD